MSQPLFLRPELLLSVLHQLIVPVRIHVPLFFDLLKLGFDSQLQLSALFKELALFLILV